MPFVGVIVGGGEATGAGAGATSGDAAGKGPGANAGKAPGPGAGASSGVRPSGLYCDGTEEDSGEGDVGVISGRGIIVGGGSPESSP